MMSLESKSKKFFSAELWEDVQKLARSAKYKIDDISLVSGDASGRRYWRIYNESKTAILMSSPITTDYLPGRQTVPERLELGYDASVRRNKYDLSAFCHVRDLLSRNGVSTPKIYGLNFEKGLAILEDFGLMSLEIARNLGISDQFLVSHSLEILKQLQNIDKDSYVKNIASSWMIESMDELALKTEADLFVTHYLPFRLGRSLTEAELLGWNTETSRVFSKLKTDTLVLRDFHSPNILCRQYNGSCQLGLIDFQDALWGDPIYDFASIMYDARFSWPVETIDFFVQRWSKLNDIPVDIVEENASVVALQRNLKILGEFIRFSTVGDDRYLKHIPRVSRYLEQCLTYDSCSSIKLYLKELLGTKSNRL